ncbi:DgyrCDS14199 [Dimorphilus gyrociliatus]|uniref:Probable ATP-dependent RNA helicase DDX52 n=1 Tax=Dimorphilus gyrociliatus TaxID=2664684 RepID=A0A7I8WD95_9ANNE|nr:DgyrCDS14199 [Dimorphilus gyrociliatus]
MLSAELKKEKAINPLDKLTIGLNISPIDINQPEEVEIQFQSNQANTITKKEKTYGKLLAKQRKRWTAFDEDLPYELLKNDGSESTSESEDEEDSITILKNMKSAIQNGNKEKKKTNSSKTKMSFSKLLAQRQDNINLFRKNHGITIGGEVVPEPIQNWNDLQKQYKINYNLLENILKSGYELPTPVQMQAIPAMIERHEVLACAPTGSGKTMAFIIPLIHYILTTSPKWKNKQSSKTEKIKGCLVRCLVLAPTKELAQQTYKEALKLTVNLEIECTSLDDYGESSKTRADLLVATPNKLLELLKSSKHKINLSHVEWIILDESDRLMEEGINAERVGFRQQIKSVLDYCGQADNKNSHLRRAMFSATLTELVYQWAMQEFKDVVNVRVGAKNTAVTSVKQTLKYCGNEDGKVLAIRDLLSNIVDKPTLIFVQSQKRSKELWQRLMIHKGVPVGVMHGGMTQKSRALALDLLKERKLAALICTDLMARGIDVDCIKLIINYDFPQSALSYIHRIGRTGRAGRTGEAITFFTDSDRTLLRTIATVMKESGCEVSQYLLELKKASRQDKRKISKSAPRREKIQEPQASIQVQQKKKIKPKKRKATETEKQKGKTKKQRKR